MADKEKKAKTPEGEEPAPKGKKPVKAEGEAAEAASEGTDKQKPGKGISMKIIVLSAVVSLVVFVGVFSYVMGVFDPPPPETAETASETAAEGHGSDKEELAESEEYYSDYGRAAAEVDGSLEPGAVDTLAEISKLEQLRLEIASEEAGMAKERRDLILLKQEVERLLAKRDGIADEKVSYTAKLLTGMKPDELAGLISALDNRMILKILPKMKPQNAAKILASLPSKRAAEITTALLESDS